MKIAIVHEMLIKLWWAEKVVENWMENYPNADIFTLLYNEKKVENVFPKNRIHPQVFSLRTQKIYSFLWKQRICLPFMAKSIEQLDFSEYDIVLVSSSGFAHGIITKPETKTLVYYHSPARYMWDWTNEYKRDIWAQKWWKSYILNSLFLQLRQWDYIASKRHNIILSNSKNTAKRVEKYYRINTQTLYPPIETERFSKTIQKKYTLPYKNYYIILSTLTEFKRLDIAIQWFTHLSKINLVIIGDGDYRKKLENLSQKVKNISFVWAKFKDELVYLVQNSSGLIFPWEEDFWIVPIEVMAAGKPVFALEKWGLKETVIAWKTGDFFQSTRGEDFVKKFQIFHKNNTTWIYSVENCQKQAKKFDKTVFEKKISQYIKKS